MYYKRYVDDIFVLFEKPEQVLRFVNYMNERHFTDSLENEKDNSVFFSMLRLVEEKINLHQEFSEKICSVVYRLI